MTWQQVRTKTTLCCILLSIAYESATASSADEYMQVASKQTSTVGASRISIIKKLLNTGKFSQAEKLITEHLRKYPKDADFLLLLSRAQHQLNRKSEAVKTLQQARRYAKGYEDLYLLEARYLIDTDTSQACQELHVLNEAYYKNTPRKNLENFESILASRKKEKNRIEFSQSYDELNNNRGVWYASSLRHQWKTCSGTSWNVGYQKVERYRIEDDEFSLGLGLRGEWLGVEFELSKSGNKGLLPKQAMSGIVTIGTGLSADVLMLGSSKKYDGLETSSLGFGIDYYFGNYQIMFIAEQTEYLRNSKTLDDSQTNRLYLGYYFSKETYMRYGYITGKELNNDGSPNPPYSKVKTIILTAAMPISNNLGLTIEIKRHHQSGYFEQNGIRLGINYTY
ncbi:MAG: YaiO family outer membrane beta-barrel protein [Gammaproteobacteria bacterium]|nr:YaiO family outer membrane beta-barrel protein [Gammaproteobacteria bacterium]